MCCVLQHHISFETAELRTTTVSQPFSHSVGPDWGKAIWLSGHLYSALSENGFSDSDLFFVPMFFVSIVKTKGKKARARGEKKQVWPKPSQLSPRCLTEVIVSDRGSSHEPWTETGWN